MTDHSASTMYGKEVIDLTIFGLRSIYSAAFTSMSHTSSIDFAA